ncbi:MAG: F0F1 ATP synthase subunit delta [Muribaculaceae bacterium]|nr:F0F1 ATP synthase subunit delta [Muribaculaceae bacterium]
MDNGLIPRRYAKALYKFALEKGETKRIYDLSKRVIEAFRENPDLQKVLSNPFISDEDKEKLLVTAAGQKDEIFDKFILLILAQKRVEYAQAMMLAYRDIYRKENHISQAKITTAVKLDDSTMKKLRKLVTDAFKDSELEFSEAIDPALIGGFVIDVDSVRMDASLSNELEQLRQTLLS